MDTATEIRIREQELHDTYAKRFDDILEGMADRMLDKILTFKVPCIRYGWRKRRQRLLIASQCVGWKVAIDAGDVAARPVAHGEFYR